MSFKKDSLFRVRSAALWLLILALFCLLAACGPRPQDGEWQQNVSSKARFTKIDRESRRAEIRIGLRRRALLFSDDAKIFDDLRVGDEFRFTYHEAISMRRLGRSESVPTELRKYHLSPQTSELPTVARARARQFTAIFVESDYQSNLATFKTPDGSYPQLLVPLGLRPFVRSLLPGERVAVSIEEAISVTLPNRDQ